MILWLSVIGVLVLVVAAATWMVQRSIDRSAQGPRRVERDVAGQGQFGL